MEILVGDVGGTNTTLAVIETEHGRFHVQTKKRYKSAALTGVHDAINDFMAHTPALKPEICCISAAGPVRNNTCRMTNVRWSIDGDEVGRQLSVQTFVINDFSAICHALPLIETHDEIDAIPLQHTDGSLPKPHGTVRAVVGAGTGLGTGFLIEDHGHFVAYPSEGGHADFAPIDPEMIGLQRFVNRIRPLPPGIEQYVSGQGISNIYRYYRDSEKLTDSKACARIDPLSEREKPKAIAAQAEHDREFAAIMDLFVRMYARYASTATLFFLPSAGLYLAGGIAAKNESWFTGEHRFMKAFEDNYNDRITPLLMATPVYLIKDYDISLYGAAHAALSLQ